uniref:Uncharacterized protein n=1 Tax=Dendroctonus ponderosae TaxID=77166 RepID=A0AAR5Q6C1_DENPD
MMTSFQQQKYTQLQQPTVPATMMPSGSPSLPMMPPPHMAPPPHMPPFPAHLMMAQPAGMGLMQPPLPPMPPQMPLAACSILPHQASVASPVPPPPVELELEAEPQYDDPPAPGTEEPPAKSPKLDGKLFQTRQVRAFV